MARTRRQQLARALSAHAGITYQQALERVNDFVDRTGTLPRGAHAISALTDTPDPASVPDPARAADAGARGGGELSADDLVAVATVVRPLSFVIRSTDIGRCPYSVLSVAHYLPTGECAHLSPQCPTCRGRGRLRGPAGTVTCSAGAGLTSGVPVCNGSGVWTGEMSPYVDDVPDLDLDWGLDS